MTECSETLFPFEAHFSRQVVAQFEGSWLSTEGGSLLLRQADRNPFVGPNGSARNNRSLRMRLKGEGPLARVT
jgi:hypothetical protein